METLGFLWLIRLRWLALGFYLILAAFAGVWLDIQLPLGILSLFILSLFLSNLVLHLYWDYWSRFAKVLTLFFLFLDTGLLTLLLYYTGGAHNPFTLLYLLHITMAILLLSGWWASAMVIFCTVAFSILFLSPHMMVNSDGQALCSDMQFHLWGMLVATFVTGTGIVYFAGELKKDLQKKQKTIQEAIHVREQHNRHAGLMTLAAGVAHELSTPLSTIAVISDDLESGLGKEASSKIERDEVRLIREQVEKCRHILQRLSSCKNNEEIRAEETWYEAANLPALIEGYVSDAVKDRLCIRSTGRSRKILLSKDLFLQSVGILVQNALEASPNDQIILVQINVDEDKWICEVSDQGCGVPEEKMDRLGEPFFTTKANQHGMGLGLYLVRTFMDSVRGKLEINSQEKVGTTVRMIFSQI